VNAGAAVNVRRIFVGEEEDLHVLFLLIVSHLLSKVERVTRPC
jgi:hypothetical protein